MPPHIIILCVIAGIFACAALIAVLVLFFKIKITVEYKDALAVYIHVPFGKIKVFPFKEEDEKSRGPHRMSKRKAERIKRKLCEKAEKRKQKKSTKKKADGQQKKDTSKTKLTVDDVLDIISAIKDILTTLIGKLFKYIRIDLARIHVTVATDDAATTAIAYGVVCDALLHLFCILEPLKGFKLPKTKDVSVCADYLSESPTVDVKLSFSIRVWQVIYISTVTGIKTLLHFFKIKDKFESKPTGQKNKEANTVHIKKGN